jgi:hypothetical protein
MNAKFESALQDKYTRFVTGQLERRKVAEYDHDPNIDWEVEQTNHLREKYGFSLDLAEVILGRIITEVRLESVEREIHGKA